jgi:hypothetical protein
MPGEDYYSGLPSLADKLQAFADWHASPEVRHISEYEAQLITTAAERLEQSARGIRRLRAQLETLTY